MEEDDDMTEAERLQYHLSEAGDIEHSLSNADKGEASVLGRVFYALQLLTHELYGDKQ